MSSIPKWKVVDMVNDLTRIENFLRKLKADGDVIPADELGTVRAIVVTTRRRLLEAAVVDLEVDATAL